MKLLLKKWKRFLNEQEETKEDIFRQNVEIINKVSKNTIYLDKRFLAPAYLKGINTLRRSRLKKFLGAGAFGLAFLLENDHVFKLFTDGTKGDGADLAYYKTLHDAQFSGKGSVNTPAIYDYGDYMGLMYVEMGKVMPLEDWLALSERTGASNVNRELSSIARTIHMALRIPIYTDFETFLQQINQLRISPVINEIKKLDLSILTKDEAVSYAKALIETGLASNSTPYDLDAHEGNVGVMIQSPRKWVVFDI